MKYDLANPFLYECDRRERVRQMIRIFYGHFLNEDPDVAYAGYMALGSFAVSGDQYTAKVMAPLVLNFLESKLQSSLPDWSRTFSALNMLQPCCRSLSKSQRQSLMSKLVKLLPVYEEVPCQLEILYRMKELWTVDASPRVTYPEADGLLT